MNEDKIIDIFIILAAITVIVLKCINVITIPWIWLLCPIWGLFALGLGMAIVMLIIFKIETWFHKGEK